MAAYASAANMVRSSGRGPLAIELGGMPKPARVLAQVPPVIESLTGLKFQDLLDRVRSRDGDVAAPPQESHPAASVDSRTPLPEAAPTGLPAVPPPVRPDRLPKA